MTKTIQHYDNMDERSDLVTMYENMGYQMLHDDFDPDWKRGDEPHGTMTFTNEPEPVVITPPVRDLAAELDTLQARVSKLEKTAN